MKAVIFANGKEIMLNCFVEEFVASVLIGVAKGLNGYEEGSAIDIEMGETLTMRMGGEDVKLVPFVERIVKGIVVGMLKELDDFEEGAKISISVAERGEK